MEFIEPTVQMWLTYAVVAGAIVTYSIDRIPLEISSIATVALLLLLFQFYPVLDNAGNNIVGTREILKGFADPALITIMALLVTGQGLVQTGALNGPAQMLLNFGAKRPKLVITLSLVAVMLVSAVLNNTPVVVIFIPILTVLADKLSKDSSHVMMPLSFVAILGGNLTIIGSSTNLLAIGAYQQAGGPPVYFFDFTIPGAFMAAIGLVYILFVLPKLLQARASLAKRLSGGRGKQFIFQIEVGEGDQLEGQTAVSGIFPKLTSVTVRMIQRDGEQLLPPYDEITLQKGDTVLVAATRIVMTDLLNTDPEMLTTVDETGKKQESKVIAEAVIAPASRMDGRTIAMTGFHSETGCNVIGVQRRSRMIRAELADLRVEAGDVLLIMGTSKNIQKLRTSTDVLLMEWSKSDLPKTHYAGRAQLIFLGVVTSAASGFFPIVLAALLGAIAMLVTGCLNVRQAARSIDKRVYTIVGAALALGTAMQATGGASYLAHNVVESMTGAPIWLLLSVFFLLVALLTNVLSNNATAVLFTPVGLSIATEMGVDPMPFLIAVIFGANCSFATPMSYQTNLLVMAPGHYRFSDFLKAGTPLIFIMWIAFTAFVPWYYGLL